MDFLDEVSKQFVDDAIEKHGYFHNKHEFESVLREEIEESKEEIKKIKKMHKKMWDNIRKNKDTSNQENEIIKLARFVIFETLQIIAVIEKNKISKKKYSLDDNNLKNESSKDESSKKNYYDFETQMNKVSKLIDIDDRITNLAKLFGDEIYKVNEKIKILEIENGK